MIVFYYAHKVIYKKQNTNIYIVNTLSTYTKIVLTFNTYHHQSQSLYQCCLKMIVRVHSLYRHG
jgi:hypothetical protein